MSAMEAIEKPEREDERARRCRRFDPVMNLHELLKDFARCEQGADGFADADERP